MFEVERLEVDDAGGKAGALKERAEHKLATTRLVGELNDRSAALTAVFYTYTLAVSS